MNLTFDTNFGTHDIVYFIIMFIAFIVVELAFNSLNIIKIKYYGNELYLRALIFAALMVPLKHLNIII